MRSAEGWGNVPITSITTGINRPLTRLQNSRKHPLEHPRKETGLKSVRREPAAVQAARLNGVEEGTSTRQAQSCSLLYLALYSTLSLPFPSSIHSCSCSSFTCPITSPSSTSLLEKVHVSPRRLHWPIWGEQAHLQQHRRHTSIKYTINTPLLPLCVSLLLFRPLELASNLSLVVSSALL